MNTKNNSESRERVFKALGHQSPDRVPINYVAKKELDKKLRAFYGIKTERELIDTLGCDFYFLSSRDISQNESFMPIYRGPKLIVTETERTCPFGIRFRREVRDDKFGADEAIEGPLKDAETPKDILAWQWPKPDWFDVEALLEEAELFSDKVIIGGYWSGIWGDSFRMHGFENFLVNLALKPELIRTLVNKMTDFYLELNNRTFEALKGKLDVYYFGNDFGSQNGLMLSKEMWLDFFYEPYKKLVDLAKAYDLKVMNHCCGSMVDLIDSFIELGIDIIDPVQITASGMEPHNLKEKYGNYLTFHGGVDTQQVMPQGTAEEVQDHVKNLINVLGKDGGYIMVSCNNLQVDTPVENVDAMYSTARGAWL